MTSGDAFKMYCAECGNLIDLSESYYTRYNIFTGQVDFYHMKCSIDVMTPEEKQEGRLASIENSIKAINDRLDNIERWLHIDD